MRNSSEILENVHSELKDQYRKFFESKLAIDLSNEKNIFTSVDKISEVILKLLISNKEKTIGIIRNTPKIADELKSPFYGAYFKEDESPSAEEIFSAIVIILSDKRSNLSTVMQIHCIFEYRIYDHLTISAEKQAEKIKFKKALHSHSMFSATSRPRVESTDKPTLTTKTMGFVQHPVLVKMLGDEDSTVHRRAVDRFQVNNSSFFQEAKIKNMPVICGASGHTASLLAGAKLYGEISQTELSEYALACFAFLAAGGNHSFHEVMCVATLFGLAYEAGNYSGSIPAAIKTTNVYTKIVERFPEFTL